MEQLIYIEQKDKDEATRLLKGFTDTNLRKRVFINSLGAELVMKYLAQEGVNIQNIYNMHNIFRLREEFELADVMLPNIYIDVRMVYDENLIFVPKSHFEYNLVPDIYVVLKSSDDGSYVEFLGFFESKVVDKSKENDDYYFVDKSKLISADKFVSYVRAFNGNTTQEIDEEDLSRYAMALADNDIGVDDKKELIEFLKKSASLRENMIEFDNFEWLSYTLAQEENVEKNFNKTVDEFDLFDEHDEFTDDNEEPGDTTVDEATLDDITEPEATEKTDELTENIEDTIGEQNLIDENSLSEISDLPDLSDNESVINEESIDIETDELMNLPDETELALDDITESLSDQTLEDLDIDNAVENLPEVSSSDSENIDIADTDKPGEINDSQAETEEDFLGDIQTPEDITGAEELSDADLTTDDENSDTKKSEELVDLKETEDVSVLENSNFDEQLFEMPDIENKGEIAEISPEENVVDLENLIDGNAENATTPDLDNIAEVENFADIDQLLSEGENKSENRRETDMEDSAVSTTSFENSTVISSENPVTGEIPIDINTDNADDSIEVLYDRQLDDDIAQKTVTPEKGKKGILVVAAVAAVLAVGGVAGYFAMNHKNQFTEDIPPIPENVVPADVAENPLPEDAVTPKAKKVKAEQKEEDLVAKARSGKKPAIESDYIEVQKLGWTVPDYVSYNNLFTNYLQSTGKALKLSLSSELLSATEYPYSNQIDVQVEFSKSGELLSHSIVKSSGSQQIDNIVLRTVKDTLNAVKVPTNVIVGDKITMTLKIYL